MRNFTTASQGVDLALSEALDRLGQGVHIPGDVRLGVQAHIRQHAGEEEVGTAPELPHADGFPLQVTDGAHPRRPIQFVAAPVDPRQEDEWGPAIQPADEGEHTRHAEIDLAGG
jgi:hypothetical protein